MQGIFINGKRPKTKKAVKDAVRFEPESVSVEATAITGTEFGGALSRWDGKSPIDFVGPDPYTTRNFYGTITRKADGTYRVR